MAKKYKFGKLLFMKVLVMMVLKINAIIGNICSITYENTMTLVANCSSRNLEYIPYDLQHNIKTLDLKSNKLRIINENAFAKYKLLTTLYLQNNSITDVKDNAFALLQNLKYLDLSRNGLKVIPSRAFGDLSSLLVLNLRGNEITNIHDNALINLASLTTLYLDGNYIANVEPDAFKGLNFLQSLDLQNNALKKLDAKVVQHLSHRFKSWRLYNNPWFCNCEIRWLYAFLKNDSKEFPLQWSFKEGEPKCHGPPLVKDKLFSNLNQSQFLCQISMYSSGHRIDTKLGASVQLHCKYFSNPLVLPTWFKNEHEILPSKGKTGIQNDGYEILTSVLTISNFQISDIGDYKCFVQNARGPVYISYTVSLPGVDPSEILLSTPEYSSVKPLAISESQSKDTGPDKKTVIIIVSSICGFIFLLVVTGVIVYIIIRIKRNKRIKKEERSLTFKEHLKTTILNGSNIMESKPDLKSQENLEEKLEKCPLQENDEKEGVNTYVSFKPEYPETEDQFYSSTNTNRTKESDSSNCESTSPLLENFSPIRSDSYDPLFESSNNHSFYHTPKASTLNSRYLNSDSSYDTYLSYTPYSTLSHTGPYTMPPHGHIAQTLPSKRTSVSAGYLNSIPPKKPPRLFHSRDSMSLNSQNSQTSDYGEHRPKLSLPKPGTVDKYGTAV